MRLRDPSDGHFRVDYSELFEEAFYRLKENFPFLLEALDYVTWSLERTPYADGEPCAGYEGRDLRVLVTPRTKRYPSLRILFEIGDGRVYCWHVSARE